jgi:glyceraldehyde-3-phosphate dehydrogenase (NADP+)
MLINGTWRESLNHERITVHNPATGKVVDYVPSADKSDAIQAVDAAMQARVTMKTIPVHQRSAILEKTAQRILEEKESLAKLLVQENGKTIKQCLFEIETTARIFQAFAEEGKRMFGTVIPLDTIPNLEKSIAMTIRQPLGIVVGIVPFNYPVELWAHKAAPIIASGNAGIYVLPAECPLTILKIAAIIIECGLPAGCAQYLTGYGSRFGDILVTHPEVNAVSFTGGVETAKIINMQAAPHLKKVFLELGGVDPIIVCPDADLTLAAEAVVVGRLTNGAGQICCAVKRIIVDDLVYDDFIIKLSEKLAAIQSGDPMHNTTDIGPLINRKAAENVHKQVEKSLQQGAKLLMGGHLGDGNYYPPTLLVDVNNEMSVMTEEVFGPVAPVYRAKDLNDAIRVANASSFGLQAGIFTQDINLAFKLAMEIEVGGVMINGTTAFRPGNVPFGGWKMSGLGRESFIDTLNEFTQSKTIVFNQVL